MVYKSGQVLESLYRYDGLLKDLSNLLGDELDKQEGWPFQLHDLFLGNDLEGLSRSEEPNPDS